MSNILAEPVKNKVFIQPTKAKPKKVGNIIIPDVVEDKKKQFGHGRVLAIGPEVKQVKKGDNVLYADIGPYKVQIMMQEFIVCEESEVLLILKNEDN